MNPTETESRVGVKIRQIREDYHPSRIGGQIKVLFIGESPPQPKNNKIKFFYLANSHLFWITKKAFSMAYNQQWVDNKEFLRFFQSLGCYFDDLCCDPVNHLNDEKRIQKREEGIPFLSTRILDARPAAIITLMRQIEDQVGRAVLGASFVRIFETLPFPRFRAVRTYKEGLVDILRKLIKEGVLPHSSKAGTGL